MIKEYRLVAGPDYDVQSRVNNLLLQGWELHGGPAMAMDEDGTKEYVQAMVMRENGAEAMRAAA